MSRKIFVTLPVKDLKKSIAFYAAIGMKNNPAFSDDTAACMVLSDAIHVMLATHAKFRTIMPAGREIGDPRVTTGVLLAIDADSRAAVDAVVEKATAAGGRELHPPEDHGFMYSRAFEDPDGHGWGPFWMDPKAIPPQQ
ncbi:MAG TPA: VOC family protein [Tepidisphaeraceae bacterium]|nr:VOC family protein [Tepidisphaeraceae bacterium]